MAWNYFEYVKDVAAGRVRGIWFDVWADKSTRLTRIELGEETPGFKGVCIAAFSIAQELANSCQRVVTVQVHYEYNEPNADYFFEWQGVITCHPRKEKGMVPPPPYPTDCEAVGLANSQIEGVCSQLQIV